MVDNLGGTNSWDLHLVVHGALTTSICLDEVLPSLQCSTCLEIYFKLQTYCSERAPRLVLFCAYFVPYSRQVNLKTYFSRLLVVHLLQSKDSSFFCICKLFLNRPQLGRGTPVSASKIPLILVCLQGKSLEAIYLCYNYSFSWSRNHFPIYDFSGPKDLRYWLKKTGLVHSTFPLWCPLRHYTSLKYLIGLMHASVSLASVILFSNV